MVEKSFLRQILVKNFNLEDLKNLCFDLGVDYENILGEDKSGKARELINHMDRTGRYPDLVKQCKKLRPLEFNDGTSNASHFFERFVANIDYDTLVGVDTQISKLGTYLKDPNSNFLLSVFGRGGIGKTSITYELLKRHAIQANFKKIAWINIPSMERASDHALADISRELSHQLNLQLDGAYYEWAIDLRRKIYKLQDKSLIIMNGLEENLSTTKILLDFIGINSIERMFRPHKIIFTTRSSLISFTDKIVEHRVEPLSLYHTAELCKRIAQGDEAIIQANEDEFYPIWDLTSGTPYFIKLIISRYIRTGKELSDILKGITKRSELEGFMFEKAFKELGDYFQDDEIPIKLLSPFCTMPHEEPITADELFRRSEFSGNRKLFDDALQLAVDLALVTRIKKFGLKDKNKYSIHSLLWHYICA